MHIQLLFIAPNAFFAQRLNEWRHRIVAVMFNETVHAAPCAKVRSCGLIHFSLSGIFFSYMFILFHTCFIPFSYTFIPFRYVDIPFSYTDIPFSYIFIPFRYATMPFCSQKSPLAHVNRFTDRLGHLCSSRNRWKIVCMLWVTGTYLISVFKVGFLNNQQ